MDLIETIINKRNEIYNRPTDINEKIEVNEINIFLMDTEMFCNINYTIIINDDDESWDCVSFDIPRLLTEDEMLRIGNINQYNHITGIKKYTYYDINVHWTEAEKIRTKEIDE